MKQLEDRISEIKARISNLQIAKEKFVEAFAALELCDIIDLHSIDPKDNMIKIEQRRLVFESRISDAISRLNNKIKNIKTRIEMRDAMKRAENGEATEDDQKLLQMTLAEYMSREEI